MSMYVDYADKEALDICVPCGAGLVNIRAGAVIIRDGRLLMIKSPGYDYLYSVGGRLHFGETSEAAVIREVKEETGARLEIDRLAFIQEDYFLGDTGAAQGKPVYEIGFYYYMKVPENFDPVCNTFTSDGRPEELVWVDMNSDTKLFPRFLNHGLDPSDRSVRHFSIDELGLKP